MRERIRNAAAAACLALGCVTCAHADEAVLGKARALIAAGNPRQAFTDLAALQSRLSGTPEFDYLLGVAALDSGRNEDAIIAFERVLAVMPRHAGARMDLARAYYATGAFDLAEAAFIGLRDSNPPPVAQEAINRYLDAIHTRKAQTRPGWQGYAELGMGYDSNITGVPSDFGAAAFQSFNFPGIEPTGNAIKRSAAFIHGAAAIEHSRPLTAGWSVFGGGEVKGRAYRDDSDFNQLSAELRAGGALNDGPNQWRLWASYLAFEQEGAAPGDPQPTNDRRMAGAGIDWRRALDPRTQLGLALQVSRVEFPRNAIEDFDQVLVSASWLRSFDRKGVPMLYVTGFVSDDRARNEFADGTSKSKNLGGVRAYVQYSVSPKLQTFAGLGVVGRRDKDDFARSTQVERGRDVFAEGSLGLSWQFRSHCAMRVLWAYSRNESNIDIFDFNRHEVSTAVRCDV